MSAPPSLRVRAASLVLVVAAAACSGGGGGDKKARATTTRAPEASSVSLQLGDVKVASAGPSDAKLSDDARDKVVRAVNEYVAAGIVQPLTKGTKAGDLSGAFSATALARLHGPDRATLLDEGFPKADALTAKAATVALTGLADQAGTIVLVSAGVIFDLDATVDGKPIHIHRLGDLLLAPDGDKWKITGYDVGVQREGTGLPPDTTSSTAVKKP